MTAGLQLPPPARLDVLFGSTRRRSVEELQEDYGNDSAYTHNPEQEVVLRRRVSHEVADILVTQAAIDLIHAQANQIPSHTLGKQLAVDALAEAQQTQAQAQTQAQTQTQPLRRSGRGGKPRRASLLGEMVSSTMVADVAHRMPGVVVAPPRKGWTPIGHCGGAVRGSLLLSRVRANLRQAAHKESQRDIARLQSPQRIASMASSAKRSTAIARRASGSVGQAPVSTSRRALVVQSSTDKLLEASSDPNVDAMDVRGWLKLKAGARTLAWQAASEADEKAEHRSTYSGMMPCLGTYPLLLDSAAGQAAEQVEKALLEKQRSKGVEPGAASREPRESREESREQPRKGRASARQQEVEDLEMEKEMDHELLSELMAEMKLEGGGFDEEEVVAMAKEALRQRHRERVAAAEAQKQRAANRMKAVARVGLAPRRRAPHPVGTRVIVYFDVRNKKDPSGPPVTAEYRGIVRSVANRAGKQRILFDDGDDSMIDLRHVRHHVIGDGE